MKPLVILKKQTSVPLSSDYLLIFYLSFSGLTSSKFSRKGYAKDNDFTTILTFVHLQIGIFFWFIFFCPPAPRVKYRRKQKRKEKYE